MRKRAIIVVTALVVGAAGWTGGAPPVGAAVVVTSTGSTVTATVTGSGHGTIALGCVGGQARVVNTPASPSVPCSAVTALTVNGDAAAQSFGPPSPLSSFPNLVTVTLNGSGGDDVFEGSAVRDIIAAGPGNDRVTLPATGTDDTVGLGGNGNDRLVIAGTTASESFAISTGSPTTQTVVTRGAWDAVATGADTLTVFGGAGGDILNASAVTAASTLDRVELRGDADNDILVCGAVPCTLAGGDGVNTLTGGPAPDAVFSTSSRDTIRGNGATDGISDGTSGRVGRTIVTTGTGATPDNWQVDARGDAAVRTRTVGGDASVTVALARSGRQVLDDGVGHLIYALTHPSLPIDRTVVDLAPLADQGQRVQADDRTVVDIVVPTGSWSVADGVVSFTGPYEDIDIDGPASLLVRSPYTEPNLRFAHRVIRDLLMRLPTATERTTLRDQLAGGTVTRAQAAANLTGTDAYRGLAVDRAYIGILRRTVDASGRAYWVDRLATGLVTRRLRANLYGSPEYVTKSGGTNPQYVVAAYRDILGRTASQPDIDFWVGQIEDVGLPRGTVADRFLNTPEARQVVIRDLFLRWADREPTDTEVATWLPQLGSSSTDGEVALVRFLAASTAYYSRPDA